MTIRNRSRFALALTLLAGAPISALAADVPTIADVAPRSAAVVVSIDDYKAMRASFDKTGFMEVWKDEAFQSWFRKHSKEAMDEFNKSLESINVKAEDISPPQGPVGFSSWLNPAAADQTEPTPGFLALGDWGDQAEKTDQIITEAIAKGETDKTLIVDEEEYAGVKIWKLTQPETPEGEEAEGEDDFDFDSGPEMPEIKTVFYARSGNMLVLSSELAQIERAIDAAGGKDLDSAGDSPDFAAARKSIGAHQGYAMFFPGPLGELLSAKETADRAAMSPEELSFMPPPVTKYLDILGLANVRAVAVGGRFDTDKGMLETPFTVLVPEKKGLFTLMEAPAVPFTAPSFVSADAAGFTLLQFKFDQLLPLLTDLAKQFDNEMGMQIQSGIQQAEAFAGPILSNIGPQIYLASSYAKPFAVDSQQILFATACKDVEAVSQQISTLGAGVGLQARDFQGNQIWSMPAGAGMPGIDNIAVGIGFNTLFVGNAPAVENALRQAGNKDAPGLAKDERFTTATKSLSTSGLAFGWTDTRQLVAYYEWMARNMDKVYQQQADQMFGDDPESAEAKKEFIESMKAEIPDAIKDLPNLEALLKHIGDSVVEFQITPEGIKGNSIYLRPTK